MDARVRRAMFATSAVVDELGVPGTAQANASGTSLDVALASGGTFQCDRIDIRNVAITTNVASTFRVNFFKEASRGGTSYRDSTYLGGLDVATASGCPEGIYGAPGSGGVYYGNAHNSTYGEGVSCYLPYWSYQATNPVDRSSNTQGWEVRATIQNLGASRAAPVLVTLVYELAHAQETY